MSETLTYIVDTKLKMAACVLLQALYGGDKMRLENFAGDEWLVHPTPNMRRLQGTPEEWSELAAKWREMKRDSV